MARILIVDDDAEIRYIMRIILERAGHDVAEAVNGAVALDAVRNQAPEVVVTDLLMPVMGGEQLISSLRANLNGPQPRIIVVSAHRLGDSGADAWVDKPFHPNRLIEVVQRVLRPRVDTPQPT